MVGLLPKLAKTAWHRRRCKCKTAPHKLNRNTSTSSNHANARVHRLASEETTTDAVLEQMSVLTEFLTIIASGSFNVPFLQPLAGLVERVVYIAQTTRTNQCECKDLAYRICEHLSTLAASLHLESSNSSCSNIDLYNNIDLCNFQAHIEDLYRRLERTLYMLEEISSRGKWHRLLHYKSNGRAIAACRDDLQHGFEDFRLKATIIQVHETSGLRREVKTSTKAIETMLCTYMDTTTSN